MWVNDAHTICADSVKMFISSIAKGIKLSKGTLINWQALLSKELEPQVKNMENIQA